jgi:hypothetical protein
MVSSPEYKAYLLLYPVNTLSLLKSILICWAWRTILWLPSDQHAHTLLSVSYLLHYPLLYNCAPLEGKDFLSSLNLWTPIQSLTHSNCSTDIWWNEYFHENNPNFCGSTPLSTAYNNMIIDEIGKWFLFILIFMTN